MTEKEPVGNKLAKVVRASFPDLAPDHAAERWLASNHLSEQEAEVCTRRGLASLIGDVDGRARHKEAQPGDVAATQISVTVSEQRCEPVLVRVRLVSPSTGKLTTLCEHTREDAEHNVEVCRSQREAWDRRHDFWVAALRSMNRHKANDIGALPETTRARLADLADAAWTRSADDES